MEQGTNVYELLRQMRQHKGADRYPILAGRRKIKEAEAALSSSASWKVEDVMKVSPGFCRNVG